MLRIGPRACLFIVSMLFLLSICLSIPTRDGVGLPPLVKPPVGAQPLPAAARGMHERRRWRLLLPLRVYACKSGPRRGGFRPHRYCSMNVMLLVGLLGLGSGVGACAVCACPGPSRRCAPIRQDWLSVGVASYCSGGWGAWGGACKPFVPRRHIWHNPIPRSTPRLWGSEREAGINEWIHRQSNPSCLLYFTPTPIKLHPHPDHDHPL